MPLFTAPIVFRRIGYTISICGAQTGKAPVFLRTRYYRAPNYRAGGAVAALIIRGAIALPRASPAVSPGKPRVNAA